MKNVIKSISPFVILSLFLILGSCSDPDEEVISNLEAESSLNAMESAVNNASKAKIYKADLMSLNGSGVTGTAELSLMGDQLTVKITASGLEEDMVHPQHIHGFKENNKNSKCPPASADEDGDGFVELGEGLPFYGPVLLPLTQGDGSFPTAPDGTIEFEQTYTVDNSITPLQNRAIVLHGMTAELTQEVEGEIVVVNDYIATLPVACGTIRSSQGMNE